MESTNNLQFIETLTVEQFKAAQNVAKLRVRQNPKTGKLFFQYGSKVGAVAAKGVPEHPMVSLVSGTNGEQFYLLHEEGNGGAPVIAEF